MPPLCGSYMGGVPDGNGQPLRMAAFPPIMDAGQSQRDRRRARYEANKPRFQMPAIPWKSFAIPAAVILGVGLVAGMPYVQENYLLDKGCPGHWHASFRVYEDGEPLSFQHQRFDMRYMGMAGHLHQSNDWKMHLEGGCLTVSGFFDNMGMDLARDSFELDKELHGGRVLETEGNQTLGFFLGLANATWIEKPDLPSYQPKDGERILITYGTWTTEELKSWQERVPDPLG